MERHLLNDFKIGCVENLKTEMATSKDIFGAMAKIAKKGDEAKQLTRETSVKGDQNQIGSRRQRDMSLKRAAESGRLSLERYMRESVDVDPSMLAKINPNLKTLAPQTRVAYAKFKTYKKSVVEEEPEDAHKLPAGSQVCNYCIYLNAFK